MADVIHNLTIDQVLETENTAKGAYLARYGNAPKYEDYLQSGISEYPDWLRNLLMVLTGIVLISAFALSAMRLYDLGQKTFYEGISDKTSSNVAGYAIVTIAEFSAVLFTVSATVLTNSKQERRVFYGLVAISITLAILGNATVAFKHFEFLEIVSLRFWFKILDAFGPSLFVFGASMGIERIGLNDIKARRAAKIEHEKAMQEYRKNITGFETNSEYRNLWAGSIKDKLMELNVLPTQKRVVRQWDDYQWMTVIKSVMRSKNWFEMAETSETANSSHSDNLQLSQNYNSFQSVSRFSSILSEISGLNGQEKVKAFYAAMPSHGLSKSEVAELLGVSNATVTNGTKTQNVLEGERG